MEYRHDILLPEKKKPWSHLCEIVYEKREQEINIVIPEKMQDLALVDGSLKFYNFSSFHNECLALLSWRKHYFNLVGGNPISK